MDSQSPRYRPPARPPGRRRPPQSVRLRCEPFEDRITPALFNAQTPINEGTLLTNNGCVAVGDFNNDGLPDAVFTNFGVGYGTSPGIGVGNSITIMQGRQGGGFNKLQLNTGTGTTNPSFVTVADLNGDGAQDVVVTDENGQNTGSVSVFKNDGSGNLSLTTVFSTSGNNSSGVAVADVTGDGVPDVIVCNFGKDDGTGNNVVGQGITIFSQNMGANGKGNLGFTGPLPFPTTDVSFIPTSVVAADFDGDGITDIACTVPGVPPDSTSGQAPGSVFVYKGNGLGGFTQVGTLDAGNGQSDGVLPINLQAADVNGDGKKDLIVSSAGDPNATTEFAGNSVGVILNVSTPGTLSFGFTNDLTATLHGAFATAIADYNMDGKADIAAINFGNQDGGAPPAFVSVFLGTGTGSNYTFTNGGTFNVGTKTNGQPVLGGQYLAAADFNKDGSPDLIVGTADDYVSGTLGGNTAGLLFNGTAAPPKVNAVQVGDGSAQRSVERSVTVTFSGPVTFAGGNGNAAAAFTLTRTGPGAPTGNVTLTPTVTTDGQGRTVVTLTFSGAMTEANTAAGVNPSLIDGLYTLTVLASNITGPSGLTLDGDGNGTPGGNDVVTFHRLYGDYNGDRTVDPADIFPALQNAIFTSAGQPGYTIAFDFDGNGVIDPADIFPYLQQRLFTSI